MCASYECLKATSLFTNSENSITIPSKKVLKKIKIKICVARYVGAATRPAGPRPSCCPPTLLSKGLNPSSSVGTPKDFSLDSYVRIRSLCA